jgi:hypothetical protein
VKAKRRGKRFWEKKILNICRIFTDLSKDLKIGFAKHQIHVEYFLWVYLELKTK